MKFEDTGLPDKDIYRETSELCAEVALQLGEGEEDVNNIHKNFLIVQKIIEGADEDIFDEMVCGAILSLPSKICPEIFDKIPANIQMHIQMQDDINEHVLDVVSKKIKNKNKYMAGIQTELVAKFNEKGAVFINAIFKKLVTDEAGIASQNVKKVTLEEETVAYALGVTEIVRSMQTIIHNNDTRHDMKQLQKLKFLVTLLQSIDSGQKSSLQEKFSEGLDIFRVKLQELVIPNIDNIIPDHIVH